MALLPTDEMTQCEYCVTTPAQSSFPLPARPATTLDYRLGARIVLARQLTVSSDCWV